MTFFPLIDPNLCSFDRRSDEFPYSHSNRSSTVGAGTPRYEKPELWPVQRIGGGSTSATAHPDPMRGTSPRATFSRSAIESIRQFGTFRPGRAGIDELGVYFHSNDGTGKSNGSRLFSYKCAECGPSGSGLAIMISGGSGSRH